MKIKLALLDADHTDLGRIVTVFNTTCADKFEIYSFTTLENAVAALGPARIDVFVASNAFEIDVTTLPKTCGFAYVVDTLPRSKLRASTTMLPYPMLPRNLSG